VCHHQWRVWSWKNCCCEIHNVIHIKGIMLACCIQANWFIYLFFLLLVKGVGRKFSRGGATEKITKISKKYRKIALFSLFQGGQRIKGRKIAKKRPKNSTFKPLSTIFVPCMKIQEGHAPCLPLPTPMLLVNELKHWVWVHLF